MQATITKMSVTFMTLLYFPGEGCPEHNMQYCSNCKADSSVCINDVGIYLEELCELTCLTQPICMLGEYDPHLGACFQYTCSQIEEDVTADGYFTLRKVCQLSGITNFGAYILEMTRFQITEFHCHMKLLQ